MKRPAAGGLMAFAALFGGMATLVCCALPALFVALGAGAAWAGLMSAAPGLVVLSEHKGLVFGLATALLAGAGAMQWRARRLPCPADPALARACARSRRASAIIWVIAVLTLLTGGFFAYAAPHLF